jgi:hypothetical protein
MTIIYKRSLPWWFGSVRYPRTFFTIEAGLPPFLSKFDYGVTAQGYCWTYDHMVLQFEDCVNILYGNYGYLFLFDHSCGNDRKRPDDLCVNSIREGFGGKQAEMRATKIVSGEYLGPFRNELTLEVRTFQKMVFASTDAGPYWMSPTERESSRNDRLTGKKIRPPIHGPPTHPKRAWVGAISPRTTRPAIFFFLLSYYFLLYSTTLKKPL